ncbi:hypothetical protein SCHPADRAFT_830925 [Schizopora paradoxa]|uniref:DUF4604 domain-containing protein n=1 Tax=Schizopora paradoxa TaxID=27342 RepID=A0A0H2S3Q4_9AGAM|nr:hypothetical protein SCHPADRAFT_830925 [Schizopora paradoxa]
MSKQPTPYQFKSQLAYNSTTPAFLQRIKNQMAGRSGREDEEDYDSWEPESSSGSGHRRATPPRRPDDDPGSADEDDDDEKPQVVVLKEGKHLTELEAENERRKQKGLPPLTRTDLDTSKSKEEALEDDKEGKAKSDSKKSQNHSLSFSSGLASSKGPSKKRKVAAGDDERENSGQPGETSKKSKKKAKKGKSLLSFEDGDMA